MTKLNQIIAIEKGVKTTAARTLTDAYKTIQKVPLLSGIARTYTPKDDDGDKLPPESTQVQTKVEDVITDVSNSLTRMFDVVLTKEFANTGASADVVVDDKVLLKDVPVTYMLFLEKQLVDLRTFVATLPTLDPAEQWSRSENNGAWQTAQTQTVKTKKVPRSFIVTEATERHPARAEVFHEDVMVGTWSTTKFSGAIPADRREELLERIEKLSDAVKFAREAANSVDVNDKTAGKAVMGYLFAR